jgi:hypothetical protein
MVATMSHRVAIASLRAAVLAGAMLGFVRPANAGDVWTEPFPGVRALHRTGNGLDVRVLRVDLSRPEVSLVATQPHDRMTTVSEFARRYDADIAINANFFESSSCGLMAGGGEIVEDAYEDRCTSSMGFGRENEAAVFDSASVPRGPLPASWMTEVVSGKPFLMRDGRSLTNWSRPQHLYRPNPRTALGLTADRRTLIIVVADGRRRYVPGITGFQMVAILREMGASDAINLDGGGSTELVMGGRIQNRPSDGTERLVLSHLGVRIRPDAVWNAAEVVARGVVARASDGDTVPAWLEVRNTGRHTWRSSEHGGDAPLLDLDDGAVAYVATVDRDTAPGDIARYEVTWMARGSGLRHLRARLLRHDGTSLLDHAVAWNVQVEARDNTLASEPQRAFALARARSLEFPAGMGAVVLDARRCSAAPTLGSASGRLGAVFLFVMAMVSRRRRERE